MSEGNEKCDVGRVEQANRLRKVCPECVGEGIIYLARCPNGGYVIEDCPTCHGTGFMPVTADDMEVKLK